MGLLYCGLRIKSGVTVVGNGYRIWQSRWDLPSGMTEKKIYEMQVIFYNGLTDEVFGLFQSVLQK